MCRDFVEVPFLGVHRGHLFAAQNSARCCAAAAVLKPLKGAMVNEEAVDGSVDERL